MHVHAVAIVTDDRFRHEGQSLTLGMRHVLQSVFEDLHLVGFLGQRIRGDVDFPLACRCHFVMMDLKFQSQLFAGHSHRAANILLRIDRRHGEVAALNARPMTLVARFVALTGIPSPFVGVHFVGAAVHAGTHSHVVENEEFIFGAE